VALVIGLLLGAVVAPIGLSPSAAAVSCTLPGSGTEADPYLVTQVEDLDQVAAICNFMAHYVQTADLDGVTTPVGSGASLFSGSYRGGDPADPSSPAVRRVTMAIDSGEATTGTYGLFASVRDASISHLELHGSVRSTMNGAGALIGQLDQSVTVRDVTSAVTVTGGGTAGGLIGWAFVSAGTAVLERITITGSVHPDVASVDASAGGLVGQMGGTLEDGSITIAHVAVRSGVIGGRTVDGAQWVFAEAGGLVGGSFGAMTSFGGDVTVGADGDPVQVVGEAAAGGLFGTFGVTSGPSTLSGISVWADVISPGSVNSPRTGGVIGYVSQGAGGLTLDGVRFSGTVTGSASLSASTGGAVGSTFAVDHLVLHDVEVDAVTSGAGSVGGAIGTARSLALLVLGDGATRPVTVHGSVSGGQGPVGGAIASVSITGGPAPTFVLDHVTVTASPITAPSSQGVGGLVGLLEAIATTTVTITDVAVGAPDAPVKLVPSRAGAMAGAGGLVGAVTNPQRMDVERAAVIVEIAPGAGTVAQAVGGAVGSAHLCGALRLLGVVVDGRLAGAADVGGLVGRVRNGWITCPGVTRGLTVAPSGATPSSVDATVASDATAGGVVASAQGASVLGLDAVSVGGSVTGGTLVGGFVGESRLPSLTITGGTMGATVSAVATDPDVWLRSGGIVGEVRAEAGATASITVSGTSLGGGARIIAAHPDGTADAAVLVAGGIASYGTADPPATVDVTGVPTIGAAALDVGAVSAAIVTAGRCIVSTSTSVVQWTDVVPASDVSAVRRVEPPAPDPCPEPAGGFRFSGARGGVTNGSGESGEGGGAGAAGPALTCSAPALVVGATVTCSVVAGPLDAAVEWRAVVNPPFAGGVLQTDAAGSASFSFRLTGETRGRMVTVELVDWTDPLPIGIVGTDIPIGIAAGGGADSGIVTMTGPTAAIGLALLLVGVPFRSRRGVAGAAPGTGDGAVHRQVGIA